MGSSQDNELKRKFTTASGLELKSTYTPEDLADWDYDREAGYPGQYPYTRGVYPTLYRSRLWTMRQYAGFGAAAESNARFRYLLERGQTGLSVAFDLPTQIGWTRTILFPVAKWAAWAWPLIRWRIWKPFSRTSRWDVSPPL